MTILFYSLLTLLVLEVIKRRSTYLMLMVVLPSTLFHELSHWLTAFCLGASPKFPSLLPRKVSETEWQLGSVEFVPNFFTAGFIALAPLWLLGGAAVFFVTEMWREVVEWELGVMLGYALYGSLPSRADWQIAFRYPFGMIVVLGVLYVGVVELFSRVSF